MWSSIACAGWGPDSSRWKKTPEVIVAVQRLLEHDTAGDPITGLKWTHKTTEKIAQQLQLCGIQLGRSTVARLLYDLDYSLRVNQKKLAGSSSPDRDQQFQFIQDMRQRFQRRGHPIIGVDTK